ncbi:hypothetical protein LY76DRAFT_308969 [Colletotrichum caudatum]|nr:hypothetical protein LY76DRAFT_308969 [Colletotrichum caudatum]
MGATTYATAVADIAGKCLGLSLIGLGGCVCRVIFKNRRSTGHHRPLLVSFLPYLFLSLLCPALLCSMILVIYVSVLGGGCQVPFTLLVLRLFPPSSRLTSNLNLSYSFVPSPPCPPILF